MQHYLMLFSWQIKAVLRPFMRMPALAKGVNVINGKVTYESVAQALELEYTRLEDVIYTYLEIY